MDAEEFVVIVGASLSLSTVTVTVCVSDNKPSDNVTIKMYVLLMSLSAGEA